MMPAIRTRREFSITKIDVVNFTKTLKAELEIQQRQAIRAWGRAVVAKIPFYTGTSRGVFKPVAKTVGRLGIPKKALSKRARAKIASGTTIQGKHYSLGFEAGGQYSEHNVEQKYTHYKLSYVFEFEWDLIYAIWNDIQPAPTWMHLKTPTPWGALVAGEKAWLSYVQNDLPKRLPNIAKFVKIRNLRGG